MDDGIPGVIGVLFDISGGRTLDESGNGWASTIFSSKIRFLRLCRQRRNMTVARIHPATVPPMTPPAIAPTCFVCGAARLDDRVEALEHD